MLARVLAYSAWGLGFIYGILNRGRPWLMWYIVLWRVAWFVLIVSALTILMAWLNQ